MNSSKEPIASKLKEFSDLFSKEVLKLDKFCEGIKDKFDVLLGAACKMIEDIRSFNKGYTKELKLKKEVDGKVFEDSFTAFHNSLSQVDFLSNSLISQA